MNVGLNLTNSTLASRVKKLDSEFNSAKNLELDNFAWELAQDFGLLILLSSSIRSIIFLWPANSWFFTKDLTLIIFSIKVSKIVI